jgi:hypothetical protein
VQTSAGEQGQWPFPGERDNAEEQVDDLKDWEGFYGRVEVLGEEVPEDFGPEKGFEGSCYLVYDVIRNGCSMLLLWWWWWVLNLQAAAVRMTRRAQWFLINLPMIAIKD